MVDGQRIADIRRRWSRNGGMGNDRSDEDYTDAGCRLLLRLAWDDLDWAVAALEEAQRENERHESFMRAIKDCREDPASAIAHNDIINGKALIRCAQLEAERDALQQRLDALGEPKTEYRDDDGYAIAAPDPRWYSEQRVVYRGPWVPVVSPATTEDEKGGNE